MRSEGDKGFERSLLISGEVMRTGYSALVKNCGKIIAALTALIVLLVTFTEVGFYEIGAKELTANVVLVLVASYIIYFSLEDAGEALGRESEEYQSTLAKLTSLIDRIDVTSLGALRQYLADYTAAELAHRRESLLAAEGIPPEELKRDDLSCLDRRTRGVIKGAKKLRPIRLGVGSLISVRGRAQAPEEIKSPEGKRLITLILRLIPTTVCTLFTASVMLGIKDGLGAAEIIESLVRLCPLPIVALRGYSAGYTYAAEAECEWMRVRCRIIEAFLKSEDKCND